MKNCRVTICKGFFDVLCMIMLFGPGQAAAQEEYFVIQNGARKDVVPINCILVFRIKDEVADSVKKCFPVLNESRGVAFRLKVLSILGDEIQFEHDVKIRYGHISYFYVKDKREYLSYILVGAAAASVAWNNANMISSRKHVALISFFSALGVVPAGLILATQPPVRHTNKWKLLQPALPDLIK